MEASSAALVDDGTGGVCIQQFATAALALARQEQLGGKVRDTINTLLMVWRAPCALVVGRTDARLPGFERAAADLGRQGWPVIVRRSGGTACPVSPGTLQIALARRAAAGSGIEPGYRELSGLISRLLSDLGLVADIGERPDAFCPGRYDMGVGPRKFAGLAQHWRHWDGTMVATTAASLIVEEDTGELTRVVNRFYEIAGGNRRCASSAIMDVRRAVPTRQFCIGGLMAELSDHLHDLV